MQRKTIRKHKDFVMPKTSLLAHTDCFLVKAQPVKPSCHARYGIVISKKEFKLAVQRNRAKRLLRDWVGFNEDLMLPELDYVFFGNAAVLDCDREHGRKEIKWALKRISNLYEKQKK